MTDHTAPGQTAGYLYQCRYALLALLREPLDNPQLHVSIEQLDDAAFEEDKDPVARLQTKHHIGRRANLTDACPDVWKTVGIWAAEVATKPDQLGRVRLLLISTGHAPEGSAAACLRSENRDVERALSQLRHVANTSESKSNANAYAAFNGLVASAQEKLLRSMQVIDGSPNLADLQAHLLHEIRHTGPQSHLSAILARLEGWWWSRVCIALTDAERRRISILELETALEDIREGFRRDALPIDFATADPTPSHLAPYETSPFVKQVRIVDNTDAAVTRAKRNYYRAFEQRSRWLRELLIVNDEITKFEKLLIEEIEPHVTAMNSDVTDVTDESHRADAGRKLLHWVTTAAMFPLRNVNQRYLTLGSYHILADDLRVGWHPDYRKHLELPDSKDPSAEDDAK